jgi:hypothetical protein
LCIAYAERTHAEYSRPVFEKVAQISGPPPIQSPKAAKLWMREEVGSSEFFEFFGQLSGRGKTNLSLPAVASSQPDI